MRTLTAEALAVLQGPVVPLAALVEMDLTEPLYLNSTPATLYWQGNAYSGAGGLGTVDEIRDVVGDMRPIRFTLAGVAASSIALALAEPVQGKAVRQKLAIFDPDTRAPLDVSLLATGRLDTMTVVDDVPAALLQVSAEHGGIDLVRPGNSLWSDAEQQRLYPGDTSLQCMAAQVDMRIVWPAASWGRQ